MDEATKRKLQAKLLNEHVKLLATSLNAIGLVAFGAGVLQPLIAHPPVSQINWFWVVLSAILHLLAQAVIPDALGVAP